MFVPIDSWTFILRKMVEEKAFLMKPKHQFIYPNEENEFMVPNHEKKRRLLCESMFIPIDRQALSLKDGGIRSFSFEAKHRCLLSQ